MTKVEHQLFGWGARSAPQKMNSKRSKTPHIITREMNEFKYQFKRYLVDTHQFDEYQSNEQLCYSHMINGLDLSKDDDRQYLGFLMWGKTDDYAARRSYIIEHINQQGNLGHIVTQIEYELKQHPFGVALKEFMGLNPLGGWRATADECISGYNILKFIVQFTNNQAIYEQCVAILGSLKFPTPMLMTPEELLYLAQFNPYCQVPHKVNHRGRVSRVSDFYSSVYYPSPSNEREYNRYLHDIQATIVTLPETESTNLLLLYHMCVAHYHLPTTQQELCKIGGELRSLYETDTSRIARLYLLLQQIQKRSLDGMELQEKTDSMKRLNEHMEMIDIDDEPAQMNIAIKALVYLTPQTFEKEWMIYEQLKRLFETGKINPKVRRYLERQSKEDNVTWLKEYLRKR